jgi:hypothetical protein
VPTLLARADEVMEWNEGGNLTGINFLGTDGQFVFCWVLIAVLCRPTMAPPIIFGLKPILLTARTMPTESGG